MVLTVVVLELLLLEALMLLIIILFVILLTFLHDLHALTFLLFLLPASAFSFLALLAVIFSLLMLLAETLLLLSLFSLRLFLPLLLLLGLLLGTFLLGLRFGGFLQTTLFFHLRLHLRFLVVVARAFFITGNAQDLHHVGCRVNARSGCAEHLLQEEVGGLGLVTCNDFCGFAVDLLANNQLCQLKKFDEPVDLCVFLSDGLAVELLALEKAVAVTGHLERGREDVVDVPEWRLHK